jgi:hypothetical protein
MQLFDETQLNTLQAVVNRIIPPDDDPGGWEAGAGDYIQRQLTGDLAHLLLTYRAGLDLIEAESQACHDRPFNELSPEEQDILLSKLEHGDVQRLWSIDPADFFLMLIHHTAEGFYSDPENNGGNRDHIAWQMIGFEVRG